LKHHSNPSPRKNASSNFTVKSKSSSTV
jgi:hypothetical protein